MNMLPLSSSHRLITIMVCTILFASPFSALQASSGVVSTLPLPANSGVERTAVTPAWTLASYPSATLTSAKGEQVPGAGEVLVYSNATGKLVRRVRSPLPFPHANFGRCIAACGDIMVVTDGYFSVRAIHCGTGASLWRADKPGFIIPGVAIDSGLVLLGLQDTTQISAVVLSAATGQAYKAIQWVAYSDQFPGDAVAVGGEWAAIGSPRSSPGNMLGAGMVVVEKPLVANSAMTFGAPDATPAQAFGRSVAISGTSLYVGCSTKNRVYHFDLKTGGFLGMIDPPSPAVMGFGHELSASGHLLLISSVDGPWLYDRQTGGVIRMFTETIATQGYMYRNASLCGRIAVGPAGSQFFRAVGVGGGRLNGSLVAATRSAATGVSGAQFASFNDATMSATGSGLVAAKIIGSGVTTASDTGIWTGANGMPSLMLREGTQSGTFKAGTAFRPFYSQDDSTAFTLARSSAGTVGLWRQNAATMTPTLMPGSPIGLVGSETVTVSKVNDAALAQSTSFAANLSLKISGSVSAGNDSIIVRPGLIHITEVREGQQSGISGATHAQFSPRLATTPFRVAFSSFLYGALPSVNAAVFTKLQGGSKAVALQKGEAALGVNTQFTGATVNSFIGEAISGAVTVIRGTYKTTGFTNEALWSYNHGTNARHSVAWVRGQVSYFASGVTWKRFLKVFATDDGATYFLAQIGGKGITAANDVGLWRCNLGSAAPVLILREGTVLHTAHGAALSSIQNVEVAPDGTWAMLASLSRTPASHNQVLLGGDQTTDLGYSIVAQKGTTVDRTAGPSTLLSLGLPTGNTNSAGMGSIGQCRSAKNGAVLHRDTFKDSIELISSGIWGY